jgi:hypothetical protein
MAIWLNDAEVKRPLPAELHLCGGGPQWQAFRSTQRTETWDGTIGAAPVPGTYAWRFQQQNEDGKPFTATGSHPNTQTIC